MEKEYKPMFRDLKAEEIDVRVAQVKQSGLSLLLYKDARVDQDILDETIGAMNWQRKHTRDNANCIVSLWDENKKQWVEKEDTGTESNTEKEKRFSKRLLQARVLQLAESGRELYTAPFIWIKAEDCNIEDSKRKDNYGNTIYTCRDKFIVEKITIQDKKIVQLSIGNLNNRKRVFVLDKLGGNK
jgi:hypothetical protein